MKIRVREFTERKKTGATWGVKIYQGSILRNTILLNSPGFSSQSMCQQGERKAIEIIQELIALDEKATVDTDGAFNGTRAHLLREFLTDLTAPVK